MALESEMTRIYADRYIDFDNMSVPEIIRAVRNRDTTRIKALIETGVDVNEYMHDDYIGLHALYVAAEHNYLKIARMLLNAGADVNAGTIWAEGPLYGAVCQGHVQMVDLLLKHGANPNGVITHTYRHVPPIMLCADMTPDPAAIAIARMLLDAGAEILPYIIDRILAEKSQPKRRRCVDEIMHLVAEKYPEMVTDYWIEHGPKGPGL